MRKPLKNKERKIPSTRFWGEHIFLVIIAKVQIGKRNTFAAYLMFSSLRRCNSKQHVNYVKSREATKSSWIQADALEEASMSQTNIIIN